MPFENVKYFLEILQILLDYFLFAVLTLMYHSTRGKRLQTTKGIKSCKKVQMCIELCTRVWRVLRISSDRDDQRTFLGLKFSILGFFQEGKFWQVIFWVAWFKWGFFGVFKTNVCIFRVISFYTFWKFLWLGNSAWDIFGVKFWFRDFLGFCWKPQGLFG